MVLINSTFITNGLIMYKIRAVNVQATLRSFRANLVDQIREVAIFQCDETKLVSFFPP